MSPAATDDLVALILKCFVRAQPRLTRIAVRVLHDENEARAVVQETWLVAAKTHEDLAREGDLTTDDVVLRWLGHICGRLADNHRKRRQRYAEVLERVAREPADDPDPYAAPQPSRLTDALNRLPPELRDPLHLRAADRSLKSIAESLNISVATVKRRIALAHERLKALLGPAQVPTTSSTSDDKVKQ